MAVTNLTGTTWVWNDVANLKSWGQGGTLYRSWTYNGNNFEGYYFNIEARLTIQASGNISTSNCYYFMGSYNTTAHNNGSVYYSTTSTIPTPSTTNYSFNNVTLMEITGGTDVTNPDLIAWLEVNGTLTPPAPEGYEVTFVTNGGTSVTKLEGVEELPTPLPTTTKANHVFAGWYYDSGFEEQAYSGDELTANVTLYAKWAGYEVTFVTNGGTSVTKLEDVEELPTPLPTPTKANSKFVGWYYDSGFEVQAFSGDTISSNITLYAKWYANMEDFYKDVADAIRSKNGETGTIKHTDFAYKIKNIQGAKPEETKTVTPDFASGNVVVTPTSGKVLSQVTVVKDNDLVPENIVKDVNIFGVVGTVETVVELTQAQYDALSVYDNNTYYLIVEE